MTTRALECKGVLFDMLTANQAAFGDDVALEYAAPGQFPLELVYLGGAVFDHQQLVAEGTGLAVMEPVSLSLYVRVMKRPGTVRECDVRATEIGGVVGEVLAANPQAGGFRFVQFDGGIADYHRTDDEAVTTLAYRVRAVSQFGYA